MSSLLFWTVIAVLGLIEAVIVAAALRMRVTSDPTRGFLGARRTEVLWTLLPVLLLGAIMALSFQAFHDSTVAEQASSVAR